MRALRWGALLALLCWPALAWPQAFCPGAPMRFRVTGYEALTVSTSAVGLTVATGSEFASAVVETNPIRFRADGVNPTATTGAPLPTGTSVSICAGELAVMRFIRDTSATGDAVLHIHYYGP